MHHICEVCGKDFVIKWRRGQRKCSRSCALKGRAPWNKGLRIHRTCEVCGKDFDARRKYCSVECLKKSYSKQYNAWRDPTRRESILQKWLQSQEKRISASLTTEAKKNQRDACIEREKRPEMKLFRKKEWAKRKHLTWTDLNDDPNFQRKRFAGMALRPTKPQHEVFLYIKEKFPLAREEVHDGRYSMDIFLPEIKVCVEYDGKYWHDTNKAKEKDSRRDEYFLQKGIRTLRIRDLEELKQKLSEL